MKKTILSVLLGLCVALMPVVTDAASSSQVKKPKLFNRPVINQPAYTSSLIYGYVYDSSDPSAPMTFAQIRQYNIRITASNSKEVKSAVFANDGRYTVSLASEGTPQNVVFSLTSNFYQSKMIVLKVAEERGYALFIKKNGSK